VKPEDIPRAIAILRRIAGKYAEPLAERERKHGDAFRVLVGVLMSARTKDDTTGPAVDRLFAEASSAQDLARLSEKRIEELIFPVGFYHTKAKHVKRTARMLVGEFDGKVPQTMEELLGLPGIGRKSANLILGVAFGKPSICVDTHVHRITNRWGYVQTKNPLQTEMALRKKLPERYWIEINRLLVIYGQNICTPISPYCSGCKIRQHCARVGVTNIR